MVSIGRAPLVELLIKCFPMWFCLFWLIFDVSCSNHGFLQESQEYRFPSFSCPLISTNFRIIFFSSSSDRHLIDL